MKKTKVLFICGSPNQTSMMHKISKEINDADCFYTPYYSHGYVGFLAKHGMLDYTILGGEFRKRIFQYIKTHNLSLDLHGENGGYDIVFTGSDLIIPRNIRSYKIVLVQEGMTDPENFAYYLVKYLRFPRWLSTGSTGLSHLYDLFCVASENYRKLFITKGINPDKLVVTGIPNFDNCAEFNNNDFPHKNYVLVATSDMRETYKYENRKKFIKKAVEIANGRQLIFKLHPNEKGKRATAEINKYAPGAIVIHNTNAEILIANCDTLVTRYSSVVYVGLALGKEVFSDFDVNDLKRLIPIQNGGTSAKNIADCAMTLLNQEKKYDVKEPSNQLNFKTTFWNKHSIKRKLAKIK
jgi:hypothetical protein